MAAKTSRSVKGEKLVSKPNTVLCPRCGIPMNHHAEKPYPFDESKVVEIHTCPQCGEITAVEAVLSMNTE